MRACIASPYGPRVSAAKARIAAHPAKLVSDKFDDTTEDETQTSWFD